MKRLLIVLLVLAFASPVMAASTTDRLLQRANETHGEGVVTWGNTTPITMVTTVTDGTNTAAFVDATEVMTLVGGGGAVAGTQAMMTVTVINASAATAISGTITWDSDDLLTLSITGADTTSQEKTTDGTGITLRALVTAANALTFADATVSITVAAGASLPDSSYTDYYEPEAASDLAATAFTVAVSASKTLTPIAMADETLYDTAALDFTGKTLAQFETTMEAMYGGDKITVTIADGLDTDLANAMNSVDDVGATSYEAALAFPFDAGTPPLDRLEEDRYTSVGMCVYMIDVGTSGDFEVYDGATKIWTQGLVDGATTYTVVDFRDVLAATDGEHITVRLQGDDTVTAGELFCLGRTD